MPLHLGAQVHAFLHGLFRPKEVALVRAQYDRLAERFSEIGLAGLSERDEYVHDLACQAAGYFALRQSGGQAAFIHELTERIFEYEGLFVLPDIDWTHTRTIAELWDIREELTRQRGFADNFETIGDTLSEALIILLEPIYAACPALLEDGDDDDGITVETDLLQSMGNLPKVTDHVIRTFYADELSELNLFTRLRDRLDRNIVGASGGNPADPGSFNRTPKMPEQYDAKSPLQLVNTYLGGTPLLGLFGQNVDFNIPTQARFEHHHIVAGSGHGKTQTLQYLIARDLEAVVEGDRSVIVLDSQGDLIRNISNLAVFAPDGELHDRIVIIDPSDVEWPVSLNLFDVGMERLEGYAPLERERLTNSILELYDFVLGTLLSAEMTQKQNVIFRYVTRLMLHIPDATIHTLRELMESDSQKKFAAEIATLTGTAKQFFETEFASREFEQTKKQVLRRLWGILENQTFERMFAHPRSKLDLFSEMNAGKVILINTAKDLLKEQGTEIFGRFFIAMIAQAAQERATLSAHKRTPTIVYVDEAQDYFDRNIGLILAQARKYNVGMVLAHQYLGQLEPKLQEAFAANTAIKFAGGVSAKDARSLAPMLYCQPELIEAQPKGSFAAHVRGQTKSAVPLSFPFGYLEDLPKMTKADRTELQQVMRDRYAIHYSKLGETEAASDASLSEESEQYGPEEARPAFPPNARKPATEGAPEKSQSGQIDTDAGESW